MYLLKSFSTLDLTCLYEVEYPVGASESVSGIVRAIGGYGFYDQDGAAQAAVALPRQYTVNAVAVKADRYQLGTWLNTLRGLRGVRGTLTRQMLDGSIQTCTARLVKADAPGAAGMTSHQDVTLAFELLTFWKSAYHTLTDTSGVDNAVTFNPTNAGNARASDCILTVKAITNAITEIDIEHLYSGNKLVWTGTLAAGETLRIDSGLCSVWGVSGAWAGLDLSDNLATDWLAIPANTIEQVDVDLTGGTSSNEVTFYWYDTYE